MSTVRISLAKWNKANNLLKNFPWEHNDYKDKIDWLKDMYGQGLTNVQLINRFMEQFDKEGLL